MHHMKRITVPISTEAYHKLVSLADKNSRSLANQCSLFLEEKVEQMPKVARAKILPKLKAGFAYWPVVFTLAATAVTGLCVWGAAHYLLPEEHQHSFKPVLGPTAQRWLDHGSEDDSFGYAAPNEHISKQIEAREVSK